MRTRITNAPISAVNRKVFRFPVSAQTLKMPLTLSLIAVNGFHPQIISCPVKIPTSMASGTFRVAMATASVRIGATRVK